MIIAYDQQQSEHYNSLERAFQAAMALHQGIGMSGLAFDKLRVVLSSEEIVEINDMFRKLKVPKEARITD